MLFRYMGDVCTLLLFIVCSQSCSSLGGIRRRIREMNNLPFLSFIHCMYIVHPYIGSTTVLSDTAAFYPGHPYIGSTTVLPNI